MLLWLLLVLLLFRLSIKRRVGHIDNVRCNYDMCNRKKNGCKINRDQYVQRGSDDERGNHDNKIIMLAMRRTMIHDE